MPFIKFEYCENEWKLRVDTCKQQKEGKEDVI